jgi:GT2 family glycosyltransferase|uniref:Glycosyltransferase family 2 protein n=1 Tax=candidate division WOR-3 bacterium TaxID=2052148 RepID=A0A7V3RFT8_UNCW3
MHKTLIGNQSRVAVVILNWNGWKDTIECLESLQQVTYPPFQILVVDNGSTDDSVKKILMWARSRFKGYSTFLKYNIQSKLIEENGGIGEEKSLVIIRSKENLGYAGGNNIGIRYALKHKADYVLILNNDTVVAPDFFEQLLKVALTEENIGILGPKSYFYSEPNVIQSCGCKMNLWTGRGKLIGNCEVDYGQYNRIMEVDWVSGAAMLIKNEVFRKVGLLDEAFYLCYEENDFCHRARRSGFTILAVPQAKIWHKAVRTSIKPIMEYYLVRNRLLFMKKNAPIMRFFFFFYCYILGTSVRLISYLFAKNKKSIRAILIGLLHGFFLLTDKKKNFNDYGVHHF